MKKLYSNPEAELFMLLSYEDILTESENEDVVQDCWGDKTDDDKGEDTFDYNMSENA